MKKKNRILFLTLIVSQLIGTVACLMQYTVLSILFYHLMVTLALLNLLCNKRHILGAILWAVLTIYLTRGLGIIGIIAYVVLFFAIH